MHENCECETCKLMRQGLSEEEAFAQVRKAQEEMIEKYGFVVHGVPQNAHTHGLERKNHLNLQIVLSLPMETSQRIFWEFYNRIKEGEVFRPNTYVSQIIKNFSVLLLKAKNEDEEVLRIIFPDARGKFPHQAECNSEFAKQSAGCEIFVGNSKKIE